MSKFIHTRVMTVPDRFDKKIIVDTLNNHFGTQLNSRFFTRYGLRPKCYLLCIEGDQPRRLIDDYRCFVKGMLVGISIEQGGQDERDNK